MATASSSARADDAHAAWGDPADSRMYRDKTRRKRESGAAELPRSAPPPVSESDLVRAAIGVL